MALSVLDEAMAYLNNFCRLDTHLKNTVMLNNKRILNTTLRHSYTKENRVPSPRT